MSGSTPSPGGTPAMPAPATGTPSSPTAPASGATAAQEAFGKYKARLAGGPVGFPMMPGWAMPPSMGALPGYPAGFPYMPQGPQQEHPMGSLAHRLGTTIRLGIDLLNAALASSTGALGGMASQPWGGPSHGQGYSCDPCGYDCCDVMSCGCCRSGVHGCGCGCCC
jgi:hypothetical protein